MAKIRLIMKSILLTILAVGMTGQNAWSASYDTLPKNVNTVVFKQVMVSKIESEYDAKGQQETLDLKEEFTSSRLEDVSSVIKSYFEQLKAISPEAYSNFSLGEFSADVEANVNAQGFGYGFGVTDRLTVYASVPMYHITTDIKFRQSKESNIAAVQATIRNANPDSAIGKFVKDLTLQLPSTNSELLQSLVVNYYKYKPIGKWEKDALGDAEIGFIYRLTDYSDRGMSISAGAILPTGEADDPDSLQDVSTGDGQYDAFVEAAAGISFFDNTFQFDIKGRYTYQFASEKEVRWIDDVDMPLSSQKQTVNQKLGNKIDTTLTLTYNPTHWMNLNSSLILGQTEATTYANVADPKVRRALEEDTGNESRWARIGIGFSTIEAYKRKQFEMPFDIGVTAQRLLNGKNTASYDRIDLDLKLYF
ncbi:hypothetical protein DOM21_05990 [Bacteriovorax stolpii]|uniref:Uncharacterized protein n=2 Tax=Bacteriovorax stolpii TaxID=960 RepID=A0A2K9NTZ8_BACTC|nr:hypothetical protein C0V70_12950 [Bacteriovorax stolpii]QDK41011.1 hypothetical protein DOM21_05990 [Bacteriovorax stolpii]TDP55483.1 hypothetical protein C8D79_0533 [Bacteriovorax stolpii]